MFPPYFSLDMPIPCGFAGEYIFFSAQKKFICCAHVHNGEMFVYMEKEDLKFVSVRVPKELAELAKARAKSQHRNLQGHMRHLLEQDVIQAGLENSAQKSSSKASNIQPRVGVVIEPGLETSATLSSTRMTGRSRKNG